MFGRKTVADQRSLWRPEVANEVGKDYTIL
jgi:hypothetical protein